MNEISLNIGGQKYAGWTSVNVNRSMESLSGAFSLSITDNTRDIKNKTPVLVPGQNCQVFIDKFQILDGYIDSVTIRVEKETHTISIIGRDKAGDLVDCSVISNTAGWSGLKIEKIIEDICKPFGIKVTAKVDTGAVIPFFQAEQGMSAFEAIQKLCSARGCLAISDTKGGIVITRTGTEKAQTQIVEGVNLLSGEGEYDFSERYSEYVVKGQKKSESQNGSDISNKWRVVDQVIKRYRPVLIVSDTETNAAAARTRARWEASVKAGKSRTFTISVNGWVQKSGKLWEINQLVSVKSLLLGVDDTLVIAGIIYRIDDEDGQITELALVDKSAYEVLKEDIIKPSGKKGNPYIA